MTDVIQPRCAREFLEQAIEKNQTDPEGALIEVRRFAAQHDTAEFSSRQQVIIQCKLGGCAVLLERASESSNLLKVSAPACPSLSREVTQ